MLSAQRYCHWAPAGGGSQSSANAVVDAHASSALITSQTAPSFHILTPTSAITIAQPGPGSAPGHLLRDRPGEPELGPVGLRLQEGRQTELGDAGAAADQDRVDVDGHALVRHRRHPGDAVLGTPPRN